MFGVPKRRWTASLVKKIAAARGRKVRLRCFSSCELVDTRFHCSGVGERKSNGLLEVEEHEVGRVGRGRSPGNNK